MKNPGSASYDPKTQEYSLSGSGANMWADKDEFHYLWKRMTGDFILTFDSTRVAFVSNSDSQ